MREAKPLRRLLWAATRKMTTQCSTQFIFCPPSSETKSQPSKTAHWRACSAGVPFRLHSMSLRLCQCHRQDINPRFSLTACLCAWNDMSLRLSSRICLCPRHDISPRFSLAACPTLSRDINPLSNLTAFLCLKLDTNPLSNLTTA